MCSPQHRTHCYCVGVLYYTIGIGRKGGQRPLILKFNSCVRNLEVLKTQILTLIEESALRFLFGSKEKKGEMNSIFKEC